MSEEQKQNVNGNEETTTVTTTTQEVTTPVETTTAETDVKVDVEDEKEEKETTNEEPSDKADDVVEETTKETKEPATTTPESEETAQTESTQESEETPQESLEELKAKIQEMEDADKERKSLNDFYEAENKANKEMEDTVAKVKQAFTETLKQYQIPLDKPLEELKKENPAQAAIVESVYNQAMNTIASKQKELQDSLVEKQNNLVMDKAAKIFKNYDLTTEQKVEAAGTFAEIMRTVGFADLNEDLKRKVQLCVADAMMKHPKVIEAPVVETTTNTTEVIESPTEDEKNKEKEEELKKAQEAELEDELAGGVGNKTNTPHITVENVLDVFSGLSSKERAAFYKEHMDIINEACKKIQRG